MRKPRKQYVPILEPANPPDSFAVEEARRAVREVIEEDRRAVEARLQCFRARREAAGRSAVVSLHECTDSHEDCDMATRPKRFRTLKEPIGAPDHFTVEQARAAVLAVMAARGETPVPDVMEPASGYTGRHTSRSRRRA
jgi:hypothetical protein